VSRTRQKEIFVAELHAYEGILARGLTPIGELVMAKAKKAAKKKKKAAKKK
jgi:hypothetical protein